MRESQVEEMVENKELVNMIPRTDGGVTTIDLILEPDKMNELGSECRLSFDEFCEVINAMVDEEEKEWHELRMKDQINVTRDRILEATIMKYAADKYKIQREQFNGSDINYIKRYDGEGRFLGEAIIVTLTSIAVMNMQIK
jgi:hypothetical protein